MTELLKGVSRAFYLTLRVLPGGLREPIGLAYLLARAADTIADTRLLPQGERLKRLLAFRAQVEGPASARALREIADSLTAMQSIPDERALLLSLPQAFALLEALPDADRQRVRSIVVTLTRGMEFDLTTFPPEDSGRVVALKDFSELDGYTYYVAGCVGEFWTEITMAHTPSLRRWDAARMSEVGVRFGKALQLTNVLRDVPKDLRIGRCYLPQSELARLGMT
ncbi:MAG: squalene/phytoene synthase family protein, partial [Chloroflexi bacterium]|nr:squalene/phytoene synthase family protein [Chloroflexota bacterium]